MGERMSPYRGGATFTGRTSIAHANAVDHIRGIGVLGAVIIILLNAAGGVTVHFGAVDLISPLFLFPFGYVLDRSFRRRRLRGTGPVVLHVTKRHLALLLLGLIEIALAQGRSWGMLLSLGIAGLVGFPFLFGGMRLRLGGAGLLFALYAFGPFAAYDIVSPLEHFAGGAIFHALPFAAFVLAASAVSLAEHEDPGLMTAIRCIVIGSLSFTAGALLALAPGMGFSVSPLSLSYLLAAFGITAIITAIFMVIADHFRMSVPVIAPLGRNPLIACGLAAVLGECIAVIGNMKLSGAPLYASVVLPALAVLIAVLVLNRKRLYIHL